MLVLANGDKIVKEKTSTSNTFRELMNYETIFNSYTKSINQLLNINRV